MEEIELSDLLSYSPINDQVCANLTFEEAIQLQEAMKPTLLTCRFQLKLSKIHHNLTLVGINDLNIRIYNLLIRDKSNIVSLLEKDGIFRLDRKIIRSIKNKPKMKSIIKATYYGDAPVLQVLLPALSETQQPKTYAKMTAVALEVAAVHSRYDLVKLLIDHGASMDQLIRTHPLLVNIVQIGDIKMVEYLLNLGANVNIIAGQRGITPLVTAFNLDNVPMVKLLLDRGANYPQNPNDSLLIRSITTNKSVEMLKLLLDLGIDRGNLDWALLNAVLWGQIEKIKMLIKAGADVNFQGNTGHSILFFATHAQFMQDGQGGQQVAWQPIQPNPEILQTLLDAGAINNN